MRASLLLRTSLYSNDEWKLSEKSELQRDFHFVDGLFSEISARV